MHEPIRHARHFVETDRTGFRNISITKLQTLEARPSIRRRRAGWPGPSAGDPADGQRLSSRFYPPAPHDLPAPDIGGYINDHMKNRVLKNH
jgi:hypothetical protein